MTAATPTANVPAIVDREVEYKPFLCEEPIRLSPRMIIDLIAKPTKSGKLCTVPQAIKFMMLCKARLLNPWEGDAFLVGYDTKDGPEFNLITAHQAFLKRAEAHPCYDGMESGVIVVIDKHYQEIEGDFVPDGAAIVGGWAKVYRKDRKIVAYRRIKLTAFNKGYGRWQSDAPGMIVKCAEADALRSSFPNSLSGLYMAEELRASVEQLRDEPKPLPTGSMDLRSPLPAPQRVIDTGDVIDSQADALTEPATPSMDEEYLAEMDRAAAEQEAERGGNQLFQTPKNNEAQKQ